MKVPKIPILKQREGISTSPVSIRSSTPSSPVLYPFDQATSVGTPYSFSIQYDSEDDFTEDFFKISTHPAHFNWRLLEINTPEWRRTVLGCLGALGSGAVQPINAYYVGVLIPIYFDIETSKTKSKTRVLALTFLGIGAFNFLTSILQHCSFAVMGERLTKRIRERLLGKR